MNKLQIKGLKGSAVKKEVERFMSENIIEMMNQPVSNHWSKNWSDGQAMNQDGTPYKGYNALVLPWVCKSFNTSLYVLSIISKICCSSKLNILSEFKVPTA